MFFFFLIFLDFLRNMSPINVESVNIFNTTFGFFILQVKELRSLTASPATRKCFSASLYHLYGHFARQYNRVLAISGAHVDDDYVLCSSSLPGL